MKVAVAIVVPRRAFMDYAEQNRRSAAKHQVAFNEGHTCIDCHKGIAHTLPPIEKHIGAPKAAPAELPAPASSAASKWRDAGCRRVGNAVQIG